MPYLLSHLKLKKTPSHRASVLPSDSGLPAVRAQAASDLTKADIPTTDLNTPRLRSRPQGDARHHQALPELPDSTGAKGHLWDRRSQVCNRTEFQSRAAFFSHYYSSLRTHFWYQPRTYEMQLSVVGRAIYAFNFVNGA